MKKEAFIEHLKIKKKQFDFFNILLLEKKGLADIQRLPTPVVPSRYTPDPRGMGSAVLEERIVATEGYQWPDFHR